MKVKMTFKASSVASIGVTVVFRLSYLLFTKF